jgi:glycosyltransferase involved in cell wall biosynthesis
VSECRVTTKVTIDSAALTKSGSQRGLGRYARSLVDALAAEGSISCALLGQPRVLPDRYDEWITALWRSVHLRRDRPDIFHATSVYHLAPGYLRSSVCSIQDIIPLDYPGYTQSGLKARAFHRLATSVPAIVVSSAHTASRIEEVLGVPTDHIFLAPLPVCVPSVSPPDHSRPRTRRYVAALMDMTTPDPRKRGALLIAVAKELSRYDIDLVLVGAHTERLAQAPGIVPVGRVSDSYMMTVYRDAVCFLYTSAYEGQGLPPQEALVAGTPVVAMRNSAMPEMLGGGAAFVDEDPDDPSGLSRVTEIVDRCRVFFESSEERARVAGRGQTHVAQFTKERFLSGILAAYSWSLASR